MEHGLWSYSWRIQARVKIAFNAPTQHLIFTVPYHSWYSGIKVLLNEFYIINPDTIVAADFSSNVPYSHMKTSKRRTNHDYFGILQLQLQNS
jgi:hypothetical protein